MNPKGNAWEWADDSVNTAFITTTTPGGSFGILMAKSIRVQPGKTYTVSGYAASHRCNGFTITPYNTDSGDISDEGRPPAKTITLTTGGNHLAQYTRFTHTFTATCNNISLYFCTSATEEARTMAAYLWLAQLQMEEGSQATAYTPCANDIAERMSVAEQKITADAIVSTVRSSSSYQNDLGNINTRIYNAEQKITADAIVNTVRSSSSYQGDLSNKANTSSVDSISGRVTATESSITQLSNSITSKVSAGEIASTINQTAQSVLIDASKIKIGAFTYGNADLYGGLPESLYCGGQVNSSDTATGISASSSQWAFWAGNGRFRVQQDGYLYAQKAKIEGEFTSGNWKLTSEGFRYLRDNIEYANMTYLEGTNYADGGGSSRVFYRTTNCDAQYGSDYKNTTYIRANAVKISAQNGADFDSCVSVTFDKHYGGNAICVYPSKGAGMLGVEGHAWSDIATYSLSADDYSGHSSRKVKNNIQTLEEVGSIIDNLTPVFFHIKEIKHIESYLD